MIFKKIKILDRYFIIALMVFIISAILTSFFLNQFLEKILISKYSHLTITLSQSLTNGASQELQIGNYKNAWSIINRTINVNDLKGFLILDENSQPLVRDFDFQTKIKEIENLNEFEIIVKNEKIILEKSKDNLFFKVHVLLPSLGNQEHFKIVFLYENIEFIESRKIFLFVNILFTFLLLIIIVFSFFLLRSKFFVALNQINSGVIKILNRESDKIEKLPVIDQYFPAMDLLSSFREEFDKIANTLKIRTQSETMSKVARQVAHDIRSPLSVLNMLIMILKDVPEEQRLMIQNATNRINDIANDLLQKSNESNILKNKLIKENDGNSPNLETQEGVLLSPIIDIIVSEKRIQFQNNSQIKIIAELEHSYDVFSSINIKELYRIISNCINNSVEAIYNNKEGVIKVGIQKYKSNSVIYIEDNGKGIPEEIISKIGEEGFTYGKDTNSTGSGNGLGIMHAKNQVKNWGGTFEILSKVDIGTTINIILPNSRAPLWFLEKIIISNNFKIFIVDDDINIHQIWNDRFRKIKRDNTNLNLISYTSPNDFLNLEIDSNAIENCLFLIDFEYLNKSLNGLDLIKEKNIQKKSVLVTSRFDELEVQNKCIDEKIYLLPKQLSYLIPIEFN